MRLVLLLVIPALFPLGCSSECETAAEKLCEVNVASDRAGCVERTAADMLAKAAAQSNTLSGKLRAKSGVADEETKEAARAECESRDWDATETKCVARLTYECAKKN